MWVGSISSRHNRIDRSMPRRGSRSTSQPVACTWSTPMRLVPKATTSTFACGSPTTTERPGATSSGSTTTWGSTASSCHGLRSIMLPDRRPKALSRSRGTTHATMRPATMMPSSSPVSATLREPPSPRTCRSVPGPRIPTTPMIRTITATTPVSISGMGPGTRSGRTTEQQLAMQTGLRSIRRRRGSSWEPPLFSPT